MTSNMTKTTLVENMKAVVNNYRTIIEGIVSKYMPSEWEVTSFGYSLLAIGFVSDKWKDGSPRHTNIEFYVGPDYHYNFKSHESTEYFRFEINPFTGGSFDPEDNTSYLKTYFNGIGILLNNEEFEKTLRDQVIKFHTEYNNFKKEYDEICNAEEKARREEEKRIREAEELKDFEEHKEAMINATGDTYVVILKNCGGKFIYRKGAVKVVTKPCTWQEANREYYNLKNRSYNTYKIVETAKVKFVA